MTSIHVKKSSDGKYYALASNKKDMRAKQPQSPVTIPSRIFEKVSNVKLKPGEMKSFSKATVSTGGKAEKNGNIWMKTEFDSEVCFASRKKYDAYDSEYGSSCRQVIKNNTNIDMKKISSATRISKVKFTR